MGCCKSGLLLTEDSPSYDPMTTETASSRADTSRAKSKFRGLTINTEGSEVGFRKSTPNFGLEMKRAVDPMSDVRPFTHASDISFDIEYTHSILHDILRSKQLYDIEVIPEDD